MHILVVLSLCLPMYLCSMQIERYEGFTQDYHSDSDGESVVIMPIESLDGVMFQEPDDIMGHGTCRELHIQDDTIALSNEEIQTLSSLVQENQIGLSGHDCRIAALEKVYTEKDSDNACIAITAGGALFAGMLSLMLNVVNLIVQSQDVLNSVNGTDI